MLKTLRMSLVATAALLSTATLAHGPDGAGEAGNRAQVNKTIEVRMVEQSGRMLFQPPSITINRGDTVRFIVRNVGELEHEMVIDTLEGTNYKLQMQANPDMEHADPNAVRVESKKDGEIIWKFTHSGVFEYVCLIPGHYEAGMHGRIMFANTGRRRHPMKKLLTSFSLSAAVLAAGLSAASAQTINGEVVKIETDRGRITLKHEAIPTLR